MEHPSIAQPTAPSPHRDAYRTAMLDWLACAVGG
jgi:hypothetical protein